MSSDDDMGEAVRPGTLALHFGGDVANPSQNPMFGELHVSVVRDVATGVVNATVQEAVQDVAQAVAQATEWLSEAVRGELISQAVVAASPSSNDLNILKAEGGHFPTTIPPAHLNLQASSEVVHDIATSTIDTVTKEALTAVVHAVENATEWLTQAVRSELVSVDLTPDNGTLSDKDVPPDTTMAPDEDLAVQGATEWITQAVASDVLAHVVAAATPPSDNLPSTEMQINNPFAQEAAIVHEIPRVSLHLENSPVAEIHALAKATVETAVCRAVHNLAQVIGNTSECLTQAVYGELLAQAAKAFSPEDPPQMDEVDQPDNNFAGLDSQHEPPSSPETTTGPVDVPALQLPQSHSDREVAAKCHDLAAPFVGEIVSSALQQTFSQRSSLEPQENAEDDYAEDGYTPLTTPTTEEKSNEMPTPSVQTPASAPSPPQTGRATPPDSKPTPRRKSPITNKRGLGTPRSQENQPASAPPTAPASPVVNETATANPEPALSQSILPPLVLHGVQASQLTSRTKHHQHKTPRKTPRQSSSSISHRDADDQSEIPRAATTTNSKLDKHSSRATIAPALELTPLSSARAAALIYTQQPPSSRQCNHHHHKPKKLRDSSSQTSPPPSPSLSTLPHPIVHEVRQDGHRGELPMTQSSQRKLSSRDMTLLEPDVADDNKLVPLMKALTGPLGTESTPSKSPSPPRASKKHHNHSHSHKSGGGGGALSPNKRSGYCQRCTFEGRSCKINDCLKHQVLPQVTHATK